MEQSDHRNLKVQRLGCEILSWKLFFCNVNCIKLNLDSTTVNCDCWKFLYLLKFSTNKIRYHLKADLLILSLHEPRSWKNV